MIRNILDASQQRKGAVANSRQIQSFKKFLAATRNSSVRST